MQFVPKECADALLLGPKEWTRKRETDGETGSRTWTRGEDRKRTVLAESKTNTGQLGYHLLNGSCGSRCCISSIQRVTEAVLHWLMVPYLNG